MVSELPLTDSKLPACYLWMGRELERGRHDLPSPIGSGSSTLLNLEQCTSQALNEWVASNIRFRRVCCLKISDRTKWLLKFLLTFLTYIWKSMQRNCIRSQLRDDMVYSFHLNRQEEYGLGWVACSKTHSQEEVLSLQMPISSFSFQHEQALFKNCYGKDYQKKKQMSS